MKKIITFLPIWISILMVMASCGNKKIAKTPIQTTSGCNSRQFWTTRLSDSCNFPLNVLKQADFYLSQPVEIRRESKNSSARIEDGVIILTDSIESILKRFDYQTSKGRINGIPQNSPGDKYPQQLSVDFTDEKSGMTITLGFKLSGMMYVLDRAGKATYQGKTYLVETYDPNMNGQVGSCKLMVCLKRETVENIDHQQ